MCMALSTQTAAMNLNLILCNLHDVCFQENGCMCSWTKDDEAPESINSTTYLQRLMMDEPVNRMQIALMEFHFGIYLKLSEISERS